MPPRTALPRLLVVVVVAVVDVVPDIVIRMGTEC